MWRILLLILILFSAVAFAQTQEQPQARKIDEFGNVTNGDVKMRMQDLQIELANNPASLGYVINYGTSKEIAVRIKQIQNTLDFLRFDRSRIMQVKGGFGGFIKTEFWIVPAGAENPQPKSTATKFDEFGNAGSGDIKARLDRFLIELQNNPNQQGFIINSGSTTEVAKREKGIKIYLLIRKADLSKVKILKGGADKNIKTELWTDSENSTQSKN